MSHKTYIGDAVYVEVDDPTGGLILTTEDGIRATNTIVMEPAVLDNFEQWIAARRRAVQPTTEKG